MSGVITLAEAIVLSAQSDKITMVTFFMALPPIQSHSEGAPAGNDNKRFGADILEFQDQPHRKGSICRELHLFYSLLRPLFYSTRVLPPSFSISIRYF